MLCLLLVLSLALGSVAIPIDQVLTALIGGETDQAAWASIVLKFRLPKTLTAMLAGMALGVSGLMMQTYFRNPLAEPFVLGVSSGASLGVALVVLSTGATGVAMIAGLGFSGDLLLTTAAGTGAGVTMALVLMVAVKVRSNLTLLILGLMFGYLVASLVSLLLYFALPERIQAYINWTFGSFSSVTTDQLPILATFVAAGLLLAAILVKPLNALLLGEDYARSMGINLRRTRLAIVLATALLVQRRHRLLRSYRLCRHRRAASLPRHPAQFRSSNPHAGHLFGRWYCRAGRRLDRRNAGQQYDPAAQRYHRSHWRSRCHARDPAAIQRTMMDSPLLQSHDLAIGYSRGSCLASALHLRLEPGKLVGLLGPNGIGKSTLLRTLAGMQAPLAGTVLLKGADVRQLNPSELARRLSLVLTNTHHPGLMTGYELVALGRLPHTDWLGNLSADDRKSIDWAMRAVGAEDLASKNVAKLSDGQRQKLMIARALAQETEIMLLDEPTAFLDLPRRVETMRLLRQLARETGRAILVSTHDLDLALRNCDILWLMSSDAMRVGVPEDLVLDDSISETFRDDGVAFDKRSGTFAASGIRRDLCVHVSADGSRAIWMRRALERIGYRSGDADHAAASLSLTQNGQGPEWQLSIDGCLTRHRSIADVLGALEDAKL